MSAADKFIAELTEGYTFKGDSIILGTAIYNGEPQQNLHIKIPLSTINRHGLIAGATGTGKTKTVQVFAEALSEKSIPVLLMDIKGDLSGIAAAGSSNPKLKNDMQRLQFSISQKSFQ